MDCLTFKMYDPLISTGNEPFVGYRQLPGLETAGVELYVLELNFFVCLLYSQYYQKTWSCWERIEVPGVDGKGEEITLNGLCDHLQVTMNKCEVIWENAGRNIDQIS